MIPVAVQRLLVNWLGVIASLSIVAGAALLVDGADIATAALFVSPATTAVGVFGGAAIFGRGTDPDD